MFVGNQPGHIDQIKQTNAGVVYRLIDQHGPVSRIELSRLAQLAPASITKIVREMVDVRLVRETEFQEIGSRGRPATGLVPDTAAWHFLAVRISKGELALTLRDLSSRCVVEDRLPLALDDIRPLQYRILDEIDRFFTRHQQRLERLTAIAITLPGMISSASGIAHRMPFYPVKDMALGPLLQERTGLPVYLQHDIYAWTLAESLFGASRGASDVIQLVIDENVGAGVISGGRMLHNASHSLVEVGHTQMDAAGLPCYCGNRGCLETVASIPHLLERFAAESRPALHQPPTVQQLCVAALQGDTLAQGLIADVGEHVGRLLAVMINIFNPQKILIASPLNLAASVLHPPVRKAIAQQSLPAYSAAVALEETQIRSQDTLTAAALITSALYDGSLLLRLLQG